MLFSNISDRSYDMTLQHGILVSILLAFIVIIVIILSAFI